MDEMKNTKELQEISFEVFNNPIRNSALSIIDLLKHHGRGDELYFFQLQGFVESSLQTYDAICDLVSKNRRKKYPAQATFLVRSIIDVFFSVAFLLDDLQIRSRRFELAGYHKRLKHFHLLNTKYKDKPDCTDYLNEFTEKLKNDVEILKITDEEKKNTKIQWPIPSRILENCNSKGLNEFLREIYTWHYSYYSEGSHISWGGIAMVVFSKMPEEEKWHPGKFESDAVVRAFEFLLMILSEIQGKFDIGLKQDLLYLWGLFAPFWDEGKQYFDFRYDNLLRG
jgi:hypothetical protein